MALRRVLILAVFLLALAGCRPDGTNIFDIGFLGIKSGPLARSGLLAWRGAELAEETWNSAHPDHRIRVHYRDVGTDPVENVREFEALWTEGVRIFVGPMQSSSVIGLYPRMFMLHSLFVAPMVADASLSHLDDSLIKIFPDISAFGEVLAREVRHKPCRKLVVVNEAANREYSLGFFDSLDGVLHLRTSGNSIRLIDHWMLPAEPGLESIRARVRIWKKNGVDCLLTALNSESLIQVSDEVANAKLRVARFSSPGAIDEILLSHPSLEGLHFYLPFDLHSTDPRFIDFTDRFKRRFHSPPSMAAAFSYEALEVVAGALVDAGVNQPDAVKIKILEKVTYPGLQGPFEFDRFGDSRRGLIRYIIKKGRFEEAPPL